MKLRRLAFVVVCLSVLLQGFAPREGPRHVFYEVCATLVDPEDPDCSCLAVHGTTILVGHVPAPCQKPGVCLACPKKFPQDPCFEADLAFVDKKNGLCETGECPGEEQGCNFGGVIDVTYNAVCVGPNCGGCPCLGGQQGKIQGLGNTVSVYDIEGNLV